MAIGFLEGPVYRLVGLQWAEEEVEAVCSSTREGVLLVKRWIYLAFGSADNFRLVEGCIDYTRYHLPGVNGKTILGNNEEARAASFAARMAFSSFAILSLLR